MQISGIDYFVTYALMVKYKSLYINLVVSTLKDYEMWQVDYMSAYFNAPMQVLILMEQLEGYEMRMSEVYRVNMNNGKQVRGSEPAGNEIEVSRKDLVSLLDNTLYGMIDRARNW